MMRSDLSFRLFMARMAPSLIASPWNTGARTRRSPPSHVVLYVSYITLILGIHSLA